MHDEGIVIIERNLNILGIFYLLADRTSSKDMPVF